jgi:hypothetical protein
MTSVNKILAIGIYDRGAGADVSARPALRIISPILQKILPNRLHEHPFGL